MRSRPLTHTQAGNYYDWLLDSRAREQFVVRHTDVSEIYWAESHAKPELQHEQQVLPHCPISTDAAAEVERVLPRVVAEGHIPRIFPPQRSLSVGRIDVADSCAVPTRGGEVRRLLTQREFRCDDR